MSDLTRYTTRPTAQTLYADQHGKWVKAEEAEARIEAWRKTADLKQLEADENEKNYLAVLARIKELEALEGALQAQVNDLLDTVHHQQSRLRAADVLADRVEVGIPGSPVAVHKARIRAALTAYREASNE